MNIYQTLRGIVMRLLNLQDARALGCDTTARMEQAVRAWDDLFYLTNQPDHSLKLAQTITGYMATLATSELTFSAGAGTRADWLQGQMDANLLPSLHEAVQLAGVGGMAAVKPYVEGSGIYVEIIPRGRIFPEHWGPNRRLDAGYFTDFDKLDDGTAVVRVEHFAMEDGGLHITNKAYRLKEAGFMGSEIPLTDVPRWAGLQPDLLVQGWTGRTLACCGCRASTRWTAAPTRSACTPTRWTASGNWMPPTRTLSGSAAPAGGG